MADIAPFILGAVFFVLLKTGFYNLGLIIFRHPSIAGIIVWLATGDINLLLAAVFFELLWLDLFYVGTYVPPDGLFAYLLCVPLMLAFGVSASQDACMLMLACLPFAFFAGKLENRLRLIQSRNYERLNGVIEGRGDIMATARSVIHKSIIRLVLVDFLFYSLSAALLYGLGRLWIYRFGAFIRVDWAAWGFLLCLAAVGGLLSLRITWARVCFGACVLILGGIHIF